MAKLLATAPGAAYAAPGNPAGPGLWQRGTATPTGPSKRPLTPPSEPDRNPSLPLGAFYAMVRVDSEPADEGGD
eukprot:7049254-Alexandrium_andersonii.AAC.1